MTDGARRIEGVGADSDLGLGFNTDLCYRSPVPEKKRLASRRKNDDERRQSDEHATRTHMVHRRRGKEGKGGRRRFASR
jgi:hypothetical protein